MKFYSKAFRIDRNLENIYIYIVFKSFSYDCLKDFNNPFMNSVAVFGTFGILINF